jgi:acetolactate synthase-1/2/3 large subunit
LGVKLSDYVFQFLAAQGVGHVFMVPGGGAMHLNDSLGRRTDIVYVCNLHEQACAIAAEAYARVTNNLGVALVTTGPGGTNAITGVAGAWLDSTPCLFLSGQVKCADRMGDLGVRQLGVQETDIVSLVRPITKYAVTVTNPDTIRFHLEKATWLAHSGRPGPVWIDIPLDIQASSVDPGRIEGFHPPSEDNSSISDRELEKQVKDTLALFDRAERPVLLAGNGVRLAGAEWKFRNLVERLGIPVLTTRLGVDLIPANHPLCFGMPGSIAPRSANFILQNSDWLLILGARLDMAFIAYSPKNFARAAKKIMVNIDPAEMRKIDSIIDLPICADAGRFLKEAVRQSNGHPRSARRAWLERCRQWKEAYPFVLPEHHARSGAVSVYAFADSLAKVLSKDAIVLPGNAGNASEIFLTAFTVKAGQRVFHNKGTGAMGFCQPAAIGACLAAGRKPTVAIDGDGGFQLNIQELETVRRLDLPVHFFVMNNQGYASIRASQRNYFGRLTGADATSGMTLPDVLNVADSYGLKTARMEENADLSGQIRRILETPGPLVCDVRIIPDEPRAPRVSSMQRPDGSMVSKPLEDMWPFLDREEFRANMISPPPAEE